MNPQNILTLLEIQTRQMTALERIAEALERMAPATTIAPNYQYPLESFASFDWSSIGAEIAQQDQYGAAVVNWRGQMFIRRSPANKYDPALWFSRCVGKDENGENKYERLVTFKPLSKFEVEPLPEKVARHVGGDRL